MLLLLCLFRCPYLFNLNPRLGREGGLMLRHRGRLRMGIMHNMRSMVNMLLIAVNRLLMLLNLPRTAPRVSKQLSHLHPLQQFQFQFPHHHQHLRQRTLILPRQIRALHLAAIVPYMHSHPTQPHPLLHLPLPTLPLPNNPNIILITHPPTIPNTTAIQIPTTTPIHPPTTIPQRQRTPQPEQKRNTKHKPRIISSTRLKIPPNPAQIMTKREVWGGGRRKIRRRK